MRCTRCDGLAVPQAVGIAPDGRVVFGWCLQCLADSDCRLVEVPATGMIHLRHALPGSGQVGKVRTANLAASADQSCWVVAVIAFLLMSWGLILLAAGLFSAAAATPAASPLGNGTPAMLKIGGVATTLMGLVLTVVLWRAKWPSGSLLLGLVRWFSLLAGLGILIYGFIDFQPGRRLAVLSSSGLALGIALLTRWLARSIPDRTDPAAPLLSRRPVTAEDRSGAGHSRRS